MLDSEALTEAVEIHRRSHRFLRWVAAALDCEILQFGTLHGDMREEDAIAEWIVRHWPHVPDDCKPAAPSGAPLQRFANFFVSYLEVSYRLAPARRAQVVAGGACWCDVCTYLGGAPKLVPRPVQSGDKHRAGLLIREHVAELAAAAGRSLAAPAVEQLLADPLVAWDAALVTYGAELLRRCSGLPSGPEVLALWRKFAWTAQGAPVFGFQLEAEQIVEAERRLLAAIDSAE